MNKMFFEMQCQILESVPKEYFSLVYQHITDNVDNIDEYLFDKLDFAIYLLGNYYLFIERKLNKIKEITKDENKSKWLIDYHLKIEIEYLEILNRVLLLEKNLTKLTSIETKIKIFLVRTRLKLVNISIVKKDSILVNDTLTYINNVEANFSDDIVTLIEIANLKAEEFYEKCLNDTITCNKILEETVSMYETKLEMNYSVNDENNDMAIKNKRGIDLLLIIKSTLKIYKD